MQMSDGEIVREYRAAAKKSMQVKILADQNLCSREEIEKILAEYGEELPKKRRRENGMNQDDNFAAVVRELKAPKEFLSFLYAEKVRVSEEISGCEKLLSGINILLNAYGEDQACGQRNI